MIDSLLRRFGGPSRLGGLEGSVGVVAGAVGIHAPTILTDGLATADTATTCTRLLHDLLARHESSSSQRQQSSPQSQVRCPKSSTTVAESSGSVTSPGSSSYSSIWRSPFPGVSAPVRGVSRILDRMPHEASLELLFAKHLRLVRVHHEKAVSSAVHRSLSLRVPVESRELLVSYHAVHRTRCPNSGYASSRAGMVLDITLTDQKVQKIYYPHDGSVRFPPPVLLLSYHQVFTTIYTIFGFLSTLFTRKIHVFCLI